MSLDLSNLSPKARASYIRIGRQFGSPDTLAQANQTLAGLSAHGAALVVFGFGAADAKQLQDARDALIDAGVGRNEARAGKKVHSAAYLAAMKDGKACRAKARAVLTSTRRALHDMDDLAAEAAVKMIDAVLEQTRSATEVDADALADQLDALRSALGDSTVATAAKNRGGPQASADLLDLAVGLRSAAAARAGAPGTPEATEDLDLLDGIVVTLARHAFQAARAAVKELGTPAMLASFELSKLYEAPAAPAQNKAAGKPANGAPAPAAAPPVS